MNAISQCMYAVIVTNLAGVAAYMSWRSLYPQMEKYASDLIYITLRQVCLLCLMPVGYVTTVLFRRHGYRQQGYLQGDDWWRMDFRMTGITGCIMAVLWVVWASYTVYSLVREMKKRIPRRSSYIASIPEENRLAREEFKAVKQEMKVHGFVGLYRDRRITGPMTTGTIFAKVRLPDLYGSAYSRDQLRVIYYHELTHYVSHDPLYKLYNFLAGLQWGMHFWSKEKECMLDEWNERHCDTCTIARLKGRMTRQEYFDSILDIIILQRAARTSYENKLLSASLSDGASRLQRRMDYAEWHEKAGKMSKGKMALFLTFFLIANVASTFMVGSILAGLNDGLYKATEKVSVETMEAADFTETFLAGSEDNTYVRIECSENKRTWRNLVVGETIEEIWSIAPGIRYISGKVFTQQGESVKISCTIVPSTEKVRIGIMKDDTGDIQYVEEVAIASYIFTVFQDGDYSIFVQNCGDQDVEVIVAYGYN